MRYLSALSTPTIASEVEARIGIGRLRPLRAGEQLHDMGGETFAGIIADHAAQLPLLRHGIPVVLLEPLNREGMRQFRILAEDGIDVRLFTEPAHALSETTLRSLGAPRAPSPAAVIVAHLRGRYTDLAADIVTACICMANARRTIEEITRVFNATPALIRHALRDEGVIPASAIIARMRCLYALWAYESGKSNFWSAAGFRTLAEVSTYLSHHTGAPLSRWKLPGGFAALLQSVATSLSDREESVRAG